ncbi:M48 family metalloprotease [Symbioplanes lichenis]|uniref:M48 family metalloprotease n=1 Tax=Symbioplanes lichenis TaxID=1629072 RepID=UPI00273A26B0|nr:M48 family metalloprotease [Actinoplanes lichenis]
MQKLVWASTAALAGFLAAAAVQLALVVVPVMLVLSTLPRGAVLRLGLPVCIATVGVMAYATWRALHTRRPEPVGIPVTRQDAPELWALLDGAAAAAGTRAPDRVTIVADAVAKLIERTRLLGLAGGRRDFYLGLPLLQAWDAAHLRAVAAHELGHFSPRLGRLAPLAWRGRTAVGRVVPRISRRNPAGPLLRAYAKFYRRVDAPFSRAQELQADRIAAEFAGPEAAAAVLRDLPALDAVHRVFHAEYLGPGWQAGHVPDDVFGGFLRVLAARADEIALVRSREPAEPSSWDTHPPRRERLTALAAIAPAPVPATAAVSSAAPAKTAAGSPSAEAPAAGSESPASEGDSPPPAPEGDAPPAASETQPALIPDLPGLGRALQQVAYPAQGRTRVGWDEFFGAARTAEMQREADAALAALSRAAGSPLATAADVLKLAEDDKLGPVTETVFPGQTAEETGRRVTELVTLLLALAALHSGAARWRHSWTGTAELVGADGSHLDLASLAAAAVAPATAADARARLAERGIDVAAAPGADTPAARPEVVGGVVNLVVDGARTDLLIVDTGLVLVPGLPRSQNGSAKRRLARIAAADPAHRETETRFVAYADVATATQLRRRSWSLDLRSGSTLTVRAALDSDELPGGWAALDNAVTFLASTR